MIYLPVSEAYAFDYLAILIVKSQLLSVIADWEFSKCRDAIMDQIGEEFTVSVLHSIEFRDLVSANQLVWEFVAKATKDECRASEVDQANQRRFEAKKALQARFWPDKPLSEVKAERPVTITNPC